MPYASPHSYAVHRARCVSILSMLLADAIERWGLANRDRLDQTEFDTLRQAWTKLRYSDAGSLDTSNMQKEDSVAVMSLFDRSERSEVAALLNSVMSWSQSQPDIPSPSVAPPRQRSTPAQHSIQPSGRTSVIAKYLWAIIAVFVVITCVVVAVALLIL